MDFKNILITGGAGFVGSNLAILFREALPELGVTVFDNLKRRGSELNLPRLRRRGSSSATATSARPRLRRSARRSTC